MRLLLLEIIYSHGKKKSLKLLSIPVFTKPDFNAKMTFFPQVDGVFKEVFVWLASKLFKNLSLVFNLNSDYHLNKAGCK